MSSEEQDPAVAAPRSINHLRGALQSAANAREATFARTQSLVGNVVLAQMLPDSAVKGGTGLKLRFGDSMTRETPDLDAALRGDREAFFVELSENLRTGWGDFTGTVIEIEQRAPEGLIERITSAHVMQPAKVKLSYRRKNFMTVDLEIGYDELEATTKEPDELEMSEEVRELIAELGLPHPAPVRVLPLHHQISQKLHACSEPGSDRAHDLVDLQLMAPIAELTLVRETAERLFAFRAAHPWPPTVVASEGWESLYAKAAEGLDVRGFAEAVVWVNQYVTALQQAPSH